MGFSIFVEGSANSCRIIVNLVPVNIEFDEGTKSESSKLLHFFGWIAITN